MKRESPFDALLLMDVIKKIEDLELGAGYILEQIDNIANTETSSSPDDGRAMILSNEYKKTDTYLQLESFINCLDGDFKRLLIALLWIGRGDYSLREYDDAFLKAEQYCTEKMADYILTIVDCSKFLKNGAVAYFGDGIYRKW